MVFKNLDMFGASGVFFLDQLFVFHYFSRASFRSVAYLPRPVFVEIGNIIRCGIDKAALANHRVSR